MKIKDGFKLRSIGSEYIVTGEGLGQVDFNEIISLCVSAAWLWQQVEGTDFDAETLAILLTEHYDVDKETAQTDVAELLKQWVEVGLVA